MFTLIESTKWISSQGYWYAIVEQWLQMCLIFLLKFQNEKLSFQINFDSDSNSNEKYYDKCLVIVCTGNAFFRIHNNHEIQSFKQQILENKNALIVLNLSILNHFIKLHFKNKCKWLFECSKPTAFDRLQSSFLQTNKTPINTKEIWKKKII